MSVNPRHWTDGLWGRQIKQQAAICDELQRLRRIATKAQAVVPGPWMASEANFVVCDFRDNDPETGRAVAEVDCYDEHSEVKIAHVTAFDPATCLRLIDMIERRSQQ